MKDRTFNVEVLFRGRWDVVATVGLPELVADAFELAKKGHPYRDVRVVEVVHYHKAPIVHAQ